MILLGTSYATPVKNQYEQRVWLENMKSGCGTEITHTIWYTLFKATDAGVSDTIYTSTESPEGCVLSTILFSIYMDNTSPCSDNMVMIKYADDTDYPNPLHLASRKMLITASPENHCTDALTDTNPVLWFARSPSGRYRTLKTTVGVRTYCFRNIAIHRLNKQLF